MSEEKEVYITDALEMMGIIEPKKIVTEISGFVPVFDVVIQHYKDPITALVFGRMWQYCGMEDGVCKASLGRIGNDLGMSGATVMRHAEKLVQDGYLIDTTPNLRNAPHVYLDGRKVEMKSRFSGGIAERKATVSERKATVSSSQLIKQDNTILNNNNSSNSKELPEGSDIAFLLANGQAVSQKQQDKALLEMQAITAFESAFGIQQSSWLDKWQNGKSDWSKFKKWVVEQWSNDNSCFDNYVKFLKFNKSKQGNFIGGLIDAPAIRRNPDDFYTSWDVFIRETKMGATSETKGVTLDDNNVPVTY